MGTSRVRGVVAMLVALTGCGGGGAAVRPAGAEPGPAGGPPVQPLPAAPSACAWSVTTEPLGVGPGQAGSVARTLLAPAPDGGVFFVAMGRGEVVGPGGRRLDLSDGRLLVGRLDRTGRLRWVRAVPAAGSLLAVRWVAALGELRALTTWTPDARSVQLWLTRIDSDGNQRDPRHATLWAEQPRGLELHWAEIGPAGGVALSAEQRGRARFENRESPPPAAEEGAGWRLAWLDPEMRAVAVAPAPAEGRAAQPALQFDERGGVAVAALRAADGDPNQLWMAYHELAGARAWERPVSWWPAEEGGAGHVDVLDLEPVPGGRGWWLLLRHRPQVGALAELQRALGQAPAEAGLVLLRVGPDGALRRRIALRSKGATVDVAVLRPAADGGVLLVVEADRPARLRVEGGAEVAARGWLRFDDAGRLVASGEVAGAGRLIAEEAVLTPAAAWLGAAPLGALRLGGTERWYGAGSAAVLRLPAGAAGAVGASEAVVFRAASLAGWDGAEALPGGGLLALTSVWGEFRWGGFSHRPPAGQDAVLLRVGPDGTLRWASPLGLRRGRAKLRGVRPDGRGGLWVALRLDRGSLLVAGGHRLEVDPSVPAWSTALLHLDGAGRVDGAWEGEEVSLSFAVAAGGEAWLARDRAVLRVRPGAEPETIWEVEGKRLRAGLHLAEAPDGGLWAAGGVEGEAAVWLWRLDAGGVARAEAAVRGAAELLEVRGEPSGGTWLLLTAQEGTRWPGLPAPAGEWQRLLARVEADGRLAWVQPVGSAGIDGTRLVAAEPGRTVLLLAQGRQVTATAFGRGGERLWQVPLGEREAGLWWGVSPRGPVSFVFTGRQGAELRVVDPSGRLSRLPVALPGWVQGAALAGERWWWLGVGDQPGARPFGAATVALGQTWLARGALRCEAGGR